MIKYLAPALLLGGCLPAPTEHVELTLRGNVAFDPNLDASTDRAQVGLVQATWDGLSIEVGEVLATTHVTGITSGAGSFELFFEGEPPDAMFTNPSNQAPDMEQATFLLGAWVDKDSTDGPSEDDDLVGASLHPFTYIRADVSPGLATAGAEEGWNFYAVDIFDLDAGALNLKPLDEDVSGATLPANLFPHHPDALAGTISASLTESTSLWVAVYSWLGDCADLPGDPVPVIGDVNEGETSFLLEGYFDAPPDNHYSAGDLFGDCKMDETVLGARIAPYMVIGGTDQSVVAYSALGNPPRLAVYLEPQGLDAAIYERLGGTMGWNVISFDATWEQAFVDWDAGVDLRGE